MALVCFACGVFLSILLASAINIPQSISRFFFSPSFSLVEEKLNAKVDKLILKDQVAELSRRAQPLKVVKKQKSECKTEPVNK
jgi:hypothetical protein